MFHRNNILTIAALCAAIMLAPRAARAHAFPEHENPAAGATVTSPPARVTIKFDAPIEKLFANLKVLDSSGRNLASKPVVDTAKQSLSAAVPPLKPGDYKVAWSVVCVDSHRTEGSYQFTVAGAPR
jgi:methionine-rich copper-binding protein CopC